MYKEYRSTIPQVVFAKGAITKFKKDATTGSKTRPVPKGRFLILLMGPATCDIHCTVTIV